MSDASMEMLASELSDKQQLRRALDQLVESCRATHPDDPALAPALLFAQYALDDTSHEGWLRKMEKRRRAMQAERIAECERYGHPEIRYDCIDTGPRCTSCEQVVR
jgi:hypothetical protein